MKFTHTFFNKKAYLELGENTNSKGIAHLFYASVISICIYFIIAITIYISAFGLIGPRDLYVKYSDMVLGEIPSNLKLTFADGHMSQNTKGVINIGNINKKDVSKFHNYENWIQVDDSKVASLENYTNSKAVVFVGSDGIVINKNNNDGIQIMPASKFGNMEVDKMSLASLSHSFANMMWKIVIVGAVSIFVFGLLTIFVVSLVWNLLLAAIVMATGMVKKHQSYSESLRYVNHAAVPALIITSIFNFLFFYTIIVIGTLYLTFRSKNKS